MRAQDRLWPKAAGNQRPLTTLSGSSIVLYVALGHGIPQALLLRADEVIQ